jgi:hypothetical protein
VCDTPLKHRALFFFSCFSWKKAIDLALPPKGLISRYQPVSIEKKTIIKHNDSLLVVTLSSINYHLFSAALLITALVIFLT